MHMSCYFSIQICNDNDRTEFHVYIYAHCNSVIVTLNIFDNNMSCIVMKQAVKIFFKKGNS